MERNELLAVLKDFTVNVTGNLMLPVKVQSSTEEPSLRAADVYLMRVPDSAASKKFAPYIIHQVITTKDQQEAGAQTSSVAVVRSVFCVYHPDEEEGGLALLGLMERLRVALLRQRVLGHRYRLDLTEGLETLIYPADTAPYYGGEMASNWILPAVEMEVERWLQ